jgi:hypothetical protein
MMDDVFIFTEAYNCGKIAKKALESFYKYHDQKVYVIGRPTDFEDLQEFKDKVGFIDVSEDQKLAADYQRGHMGTAHIFTMALRQKYNAARYVIHFDSDVIFKEESISDITDAFKEGYHLIGQRRAYKYNKCNNDQVRGLPDTVGTCFFGVDTNKISFLDFNTVQLMVVGHFNPLLHPFLDFFDPVSFDVMRNGGKVKYLSHMDYGACDENGSWENDHSKLNDLFDCGNKFIHFAGIGSGMNFFHNGYTGVPKSYAEWAIDRYALYQKSFFDETLPNREVKEEELNLIKEYLNE